MTFTVNKSFRWVLFTERDKKTKKKIKKIVAKQVNFLTKGLDNKTCRGRIFALRLKFSNPSRMPWHGKHVKSLPPFPFSI